MECDKRTVPLSHLEGSANRGGLEGLAEPGGQLLGVTLQVAVELGRGHAAHLRDLLLVDMQLARLSMGKVDLTPFALAATVAVRPGSGRGMACAVAPRCANSGEQAYTAIPRGVTVSWATSANLPSPTAIFVVCIPMGSPVARDVPETSFACIATIQASAACDKGTASLSH